jgi:F0F1-type ATP synthase membrane subunit b/b'
MFKNFVKTALLAGAMFGLLLFGGAPRAHAADRDDKCERKIHKAQENLEKAERRHGEHSRQAQERRRQLEEIRERCHRDRDHDRDHDRR